MRAIRFSRPVLSFVERGDPPGANIRFAGVRGRAVGPGAMEERKMVWGGSQLLLCARSFGRDERGVGWLRCFLSDGRSLVD